MKRADEFEMTQVAVASLEYDEARAKATSDGYPLTVTVAKIEKKFGLRENQLTNYRRRKLKRI